MYRCCTVGLTNILTFNWFRNVFINKPPTNGTVHSKWPINGIRWIRRRGGYLLMMLVECRLSITLLPVVSGSRRLSSMTFHHCICSGAILIERWWGWWVNSSHHAIFSHPFTVFPARYVPVFGAAFAHIVFNTCCSILPPRNLKYSINKCKK